LWDSLAEHRAAPEPATNLWSSLEDRLDFSRRKPRRASQVEAVRQTAASGAEDDILRDILSAVLVGGLALVAGIPLLLGLLIRAVLLVGAGLARLREKRTKRGTR
jgi:hypothetical protein